VGAAVCRECGSDAGTGWQSSEEIDYQSLDLPTGYATDAEHPGGPTPEPRLKTWQKVGIGLALLRYWRLWVAVLLAALLLLLSLGRVFF
jgi:hypothetical protein